ncbi:ABC transporter ATP-binding protein [Tropicimonas aquimaris]|uniref:ABC transporter ATP-binding protein n=1 Tax=Tropicimonas aquimaris TaxID=914152 RepID=A0ABW3IQ02_9RHOB
MSAEPAIRVEGLVKRFGGRAVVDHVSMSVNRGQITGFLGPNGSGKTTMIRVMCGLLTADEGSGEVLGYRLGRDTRRIKREIGYMTQRFSLYEDLTIRENLAFVAGLYALRPVQRVVDEVLEGLGLTSRQHQLAGTLSGGWKQRLALASCVMHKPQLLLLDEPTAGVDPKARRDFWEEIHHLAAGGMTVLVSTHYMDEAERCHFVNYISYGRLVASGTVEEVIAHAGLTTFLLEGPMDKVTAAERMLRGMPGVDETAPFGTSLHIVGKDAVALKASVQHAAAETGTRMSATETSLEDAFIRFMNQSTDNMA